jgi:NADH dehydrogenase/NADH:ubiquinone oxidoreductase subunit G
MWAEQSGHYVNLDGQVQSTHAALPAPEGVWSNEKVLTALATTLGITEENDWQKELHQSTSPVTLSGN